MTAGAQACYPARRPRAAWLRPCHQPHALSLNLAPEALMTAGARASFWPRLPRAAWPRLPRTAWPHPLLPRVLALDLALDHRMRAVLGHTHQVAAQHSLLRCCTRSHAASHLLKRRVSPGPNA